MLRAAARLAAPRCPAALGMARRMQSSTPSYTERMNATGRPLSPHVTIYAFPAGALSSITVRITGMLLCAGTTGIAGISLLSGPEAVSSTVQHLADSSFAPLLKFSVAWPLVYHFCGAFRHAIWDHKMLGFSNQTVRLSSYAVFGISTALSLAAASISLPSNEKKK